MRWFYVTEMIFSSVVPCLICVLWRILKKLHLMRNIWIFCSLFFGVLENVFAKTRWSRTYKTAHERFYGVVQGPEEENGSGESEDAQFRDFETSWCRMETAKRRRKETVYRWSEKIEVSCETLNIFLNSAYLHNNAVSLSKSNELSRNWGVV